MGLPADENGVIGPIGDMKYEDLKRVAITRLKAKA
jgi:hypothetical protein